MSTASSHQGMMAGINSALRLTAQPDKTTRLEPSVSAWSVKDHLEHLLRIDTLIEDGIESALAGKIADSGGRPNRWGYIILWSGRIPRGRGRAPEFVLPQGRSLDEIESGLTKVWERHQALGDQLDEISALRQTIPHPVLGAFTSSRWLRFGHLHHQHHDRIIADILKLS